MIVRYVNMYIGYTLFIAAPHVRYSSPRERKGENRRVRETKGMRSRAIRRGAGRASVCACDVRLNCILLIYLNHVNKFIKYVTTHLRNIRLDILILAATIVEPISESP